MRESVEHYSRAAVERAMKVQEVILRAMAKSITWGQAAEIIGISDRQMRRWRERYEEHGYDGLLDRRRGMPSGKRVPLATVEQVLGLYRERYFDLNVRHFHEKLTEEHGIGLSYTWVKQALQGAGFVAKGGKRGVHRKRRERRPVPGMLLHIDGSEHQWFQDERWHDLRRIVLDLTQKGVHVQFVKENLTFTGEDSPMSNLLLSLLGAVAEFERSMIRERQREGIALAKRAGVYKGRKPSLTSGQVEEIRRRVAAGEQKTGLAAEYRISRQTLYAALS